MKPLTLLIDADYFLYRAANASEEELEFDSDTTVVVGSFSRGQSIFRQSIKDFTTKFDTDKVLLTFTDCLWYTPSMPNQQILSGVLIIGFG